MTVTYLPQTGHIVDEPAKQNFEFIESWAVFKRSPAPSVTGSRGGNAAIASLLTQLAAQGLIVDNSTP